MEYVWLMDNPEIKDTGALAMAKALAETNDTLRSLYLRGTGVSEACRKTCSEQTNGRMEFH